MSFERFSLLAQADVADQVDELAQPLLVEPRVGVVLGQHAFERRVVALDGEHRLVHGLADGGLLGVGLQVRPAGFLGHPEDVDRSVLVGIFRVGPLGPFGVEFGVLLLEGIGDVLQEDQAEDHVLVLGRVHVAAERVGGLPQFALEAKICPIRAVCGHLFPPISGMVSSISNRRMPWPASGTAPSANSWSQTMTDSSRGNNSWTHRLIRRMRQVRIAGGWHFRRPSQSCA